MEYEQILKLIDRVSDSKLTSFQYESEGVKLSMKCGQVQTVIAAQPTVVAAQPAVDAAEAETAPAAEVKAGNTVNSPLVGTFYAAASEDAEPFVKVGDRVSKGQVIAIVEAMKLMNDIESEFDGEVAEVLVENGQIVEYGQPLFRIV